jgi:hypothetical protein
VISAYDEDVARRGYDAVMASFEEGKKKIDLLTR